LTPELASSASLLLLQSVKPSGPRSPNRKSRLAILGTLSMISRTIGKIGIARALASVLARPGSGGIVNVERSKSNSLHRMPPISCLLHAVQISSRTIFAVMVVAAGQPDFAQLVARQHPLARFGLGIVAVDDRVCSA
jgi:hypothetical protein